MPDNAMQNTVILVTRNGMGTAEPALAHKLAATYFRLLLENDDLPAAICFYAEGVHLVVDGSPALEPLAELEAKGVRLIACTTCLNFYNLVEKLKAGIAGGMGDILAAQAAAGKVITL